MALRFSGNIRIRITYKDAKPGDRAVNGSYRCTLAKLDGARVVDRTLVVVNAPASLSHAVDSSMAYDATAKAALAFAPDAWTEGEAAFDESGFFVGRSPANAWPKCEHGSRAVATCGGCGLVWCDACDPTPGAQCHACNGRGRTLAPRKTNRPGPAVNTWADGFGRWYARVRTTNTTSAERLARLAIGAELTDRNGQGVAVVQLERAPAYDTTGTIVYREVDGEHIAATGEPLADRLVQEATPLPMSPSWKGPRP